MSITSKFIQAFKPDVKEHVMWLSHMVDFAESLGDPEKHNDLVKEVNKNPMNIKLEGRDALDWAHIHFCVSTMYAKAVLRGKAFIPSSQNSYVQG
jgi:hypothetical protein